MTEASPSFGALRVQAGDLIAGKYRVEKVLAQGGMGVVLGAMHVDLMQPVAIKLILPEMGADAQMVGRFMREAQLAARIRSEHVVRIFDVGRADHGEPYMAMELLEGRDLGAELTRKGRLSVETAVDYVLQAGDALIEAHALGVVHRDLKPSNLFLTRRRDGSALVKVLDFGVSKLTRPLVEGHSADQLTHSMSMVGTPRYMSPEQISRPKSVDPRSDLWALGVILYELVSGNIPFRGETLTELMIAIATAPPIPLTDHCPDAPAELTRAIERCLEKQAELRLQGIADLARALAPLASPSAQLLVQRLTSDTLSRRWSTAPPPDARPADDEEDLVVVVPPPQAAIPAFPTARQDATPVQRDAQAMTSLDVASIEPTVGAPEPKGARRITTIIAVAGAVTIVAVGAFALGGARGGEPAPKGPAPASSPVPGVAPPSEAAAPPPVVVVAPAVEPSPSASTEVPKKAAAKPTPVAGARTTPTRPRDPTIDDRH